ncbi:hypothetical protein DID96_36120 [Burkholderia sp. Bp8963]|nr:hypothetical protein DID96_36120 [Burkholderia sp. Bp8963]
MKPYRNRPFWRKLNAVGAIIVSISTLAFALAVPDANAQGKGNSSVVKAKAPPLPNGSAQVIVKPGMSDEGWKKAYKETGRPPFNRKSVKRIGNGVERD